VRCWCARLAGRKAITVGNEFGPIRQLCLFRRRRDPSSYVPEHALAPVKESVFLPYIFSHDEVRRLLAAAASHQGRSIWAPMLRTLILVLYCTGLRLGEAVRLHTADVDLGRGSLTIRHSKGRSRIVPIRADLAVELRRYAAQRQRLVCECRRVDPEALFLRLDASPLTVKSASDVIRRLLRELGLKPPRGRIGARPYELRHAFAVHRLTAWANEGSMSTQSCPGCQPTSCTRTFWVPRSTSRRPRSCWSSPAVDSNTTCATRAGCDEQSCVAISIRPGRVVLHRVSAAPTRRERAYGARLPGCAQALVRVRRTASGVRYRRAGAYRPGRQHGRRLPRSPRVQALELGHDPQLPTRRHPKLLQKTSGA
jgi:site-specific recombinase XerD